MLDNITPYFDAIVWTAIYFTLPNFAHNSWKLGIQWYIDIVITATSLLTVSTSILLFGWAMFFALRNMHWSNSSIVHGTKSMRCQMVQNLSSLEEMQHKRLLIWKQKGALLCITLGEAVELLKQCLLAGQNNALSHLSLIRGAVLKKKCCSFPRVFCWTRTGIVINIIYYQSFVVEIRPSDSNCVYTLSPSCVNKTNIWS